MFNTVIIIGQYNLHCIYYVIHTHSTGLMLLILYHTELYNKLLIHRILCLNFLSPAITKLVPLSFFALTQINVDVQFMALAK